MMCNRVIACGLSFLPLAAPAIGAEPRGWEEKLAGALSLRLRAIDRELAGLGPKLKGLPDIPISDQGGTGGCVGVHLSASPAGDTRCALEIRFKEPGNVDLVSLVPARRYDARGLDANYGLPDSFSVELFDAAGQTTAVVAVEPDARRNPVRRGHPFFYQVDPPVPAAGLRIVADRLHPDPDSDGVFIHAWSEAFAFEGERDVAWGGEVKIVGGAAPTAPWQWQPAFLVDGETPLGLPEIPGEDHRNIGWLSKDRKDPLESASLTIDLGAANEIDAVRLFPARRPTSDLPSGFGFPKRLKVLVSDTLEDAGGGAWRVVSDAAYRNPGHNPVTIPFDATTGRYVKFEAVELWKVYESYPAFFALSEVEVLDGSENLALGKPVRSVDSMLNLITSGGRYWSGAALTDGFGPEGKLVPTREWLGLLDKRLGIETRRHDLRAESVRLINGWRRTGLAGFALLGLAGAFAIVALPIRYRIHARRELEKVRERIAGDLHDEVGSNLGSIQMFADLAEGRSGPSEELKRIQRIAAETVSAVRDIVWLLRPRGDHRIATVEHLRETASIMLESLEWKFTANEAAWATELPEESNRDLFLYFREALHNILRHAKAENVLIRAESAEGRLKLIITDDGVGIEETKLQRPSTQRALRQRADALGASFDVTSTPGEGTRLLLSVPLDRKRRPKVPAAPSPLSNA
ncbi:MAG: discoidin domain-containing protein [Akkermansiaceae bacterium]|nr:discoidin domain-containing protein [Akkermansiaceae bacterium]